MLGYLDRLRFTSQVPTGDIKVAGYLLYKRLIKGEVVQKPGAPTGKHPVTKTVLRMINMTISFDTNLFASFVI